MAGFGPHGICVTKVVNTTENYVSPFCKYIQYRVVHYVCTGLVKKNDSF